MFEKKKESAQEKGTAGGFVPGDYDIYVAKIDKDGNLLWQKTFGGPGYDWAEYVAVKSNGGIILITRSYDDGGASTGLKIAQLDAAGNTLSFGDFSDYGYKWGDTLAKLPSGGWLVAGKVITPEGGGNIYLAETDRDKKYELVKSFGGEYYEWGYSSVESRDGSSIIIGLADEPGVDLSMGNIYLMKRKPGGEYEWTRTFGGSEYDWGYSLVKTSDGGFLLTGLTFSFGQGNNDAYVIKTDAAGNCQWAKTFGTAGYEDGYYGIQSGNRLLFAGSSKPEGSRDYDSYLIITDLQGNMLQEKRFGGRGDDSAYGICESGDGGYIIAGTSNSF